MRVNIKKACSAMVKINFNARFETLSLFDENKDKQDLISCRYYNSGYCFANEQKCDNLYMSIDIPEKHKMRFLFTYIKSKK
jgi:hypothetical protein